MDEFAAVEELYQLYSQSAGISTDTRTIEPDQIYFALKGENFDGNAFASQALEKGASLAVVSDIGLKGEKYFHVRDTLDALQNLARIHRRKLLIPVLGITGSNGKTTTKELIAAVLSRKFKLSFTKGNLNNHIGVPLSVLAIPRDCEFAIIEMGANHVGEIAELCTIAMPDIGLITNIGTAHIEGFGGREGIKKGKSELYDWLAGHDGLAFINTDEEFLENLSVHVRKRIFYGTKDTPDRQAYTFDILSAGTSIRITGVSDNARQISIESGLFGEYNARNILTAVTLGLHYGVETDEVRSAIRAYLPDNNRSQLIERGGKLIVLDAYNANPTSMQLALENFRDRKGSKAVILGGMNELGTFAEEEHRQLLSLAAKSGFDEIFLVGPHFDAFDLPDGTQRFKNVNELCERLKHQPINTDLILIKGSRSLKLESALGCIH